MIFLFLHFLTKRQKKIQKPGHFLDEKQPLQVHDSSANQIPLIVYVIFPSRRLRFGGRQSNVSMTITASGVSRTIISESILGVSELL